MVDMKFGDGLLSFVCFLVKLEVGRIFVVFEIIFIYVGFLLLEILIKFLFYGYYGYRFFFLIRKFLSVCELEM